MNTIFAQCSGVGRAGVVVFRVSGPCALSALQQLICHNVDEMQPRRTYLRKIYKPKTSYIIDRAMVIFFKGPESFTGEDIFEIHAHGSIAVIKMLNAAFLSLPDLRLAEPGEFAKRSFLNGKMDLTSAEGLADLIDAETELQHQQAMRQFSGALEALYNKWREDLMQIMSLVEAYIDFPEEDIPESVLDDTLTLISNIISDMQSHLDDNHRGERLRSGIKIAILGSPNVGKSSLLNQLLEREVAIVSDIAGTTRDILETHLDINGYPIILQDTAGIRSHTSDAIEQEGISRARKAAASADIKLIMFDASSFAAESSEFIDMVDDKAIIIFNKIDCSPESQDQLLIKLAHICNRPIDQLEIVSISAKHGSNINSLLSAITSVAEKIAAPSEDPVITRTRHRAQIERAIEFLSEFSFDKDLIFAAEDLRIAVRSISNITGYITVDEILGKIFSNFCIGK